VQAVALLKNPKNEEKTSHPKCTAKSRIWGAKTPEPIATKFCMSGAVQDLITTANLCEDRLSGFGVARRLAFSIDLLRRLYNTLALLCECVICTDLNYYVKLLSRLTRLTSAYLRDQTMRVRVQCAKL